MDDVFESPTMLTSLNLTLPIIKQDQNDNEFEETETDDLIDIEFKDDHSQYQLVKPISQNKGEVSPKLSNRNEAFAKVFN